MSQVKSIELDWILSNPKLPVCYTLSPCKTKVMYYTDNRAWSNVMPLALFYSTFVALEGRK